MHHEHVWRNLLQKNVVVAMEKVDHDRRGRKTRSHYEIVKKCITPGCFAGSTRDGLVFDDIRPGVAAGEGVLIVSHGLRPIVKRRGYSK